MKRLDQVTGLPLQWMQPSAWREAYELRAGEDVVATLRERRLGEVVVLPDGMFRGPEGQSLDEMRPEDLAQALNRPIYKI